MNGVGTGEQQTPCKEPVVRTRRRKPFGSAILPLLLAGAAGLAVAMPPAPASAQGLFNFFFGSPRREAPRANAYADPNSNFNPFGGRQSEQPERRVSSPSASYCVRLCDGRYFPIQRTGNASPAQLCSSFCPAAATKVFSGSGIDHASASDGSRYASLKNAFVYREKVIDGCTCNGKDTYGLVTLKPENDPTLRSGDIVATSDGFVSYSGGGRSAQFTPVDSDARRRLSETRITPNAIPEPPPAAARASATEERRGRRAQSR
jgi:uncharacterized protein DUF2865